MKIQGIALMGAATALMSFPVMTAEARSWDRDRHRSRSSLNKRVLPRPYYPASSYHYYGNPYSAPSYRYNYQTYRNPYSSYGYSYPGYGYSYYYY